MEEKGIPTGDDLTEGMKKNEVDKGRTPLGVTFFLPAFKAASYPDDINNLTTDDFASNPGKIKWIYENMHQGDNPVLPLMVRPNLPG